MPEITNPTNPCYDVFAELEKLRHVLERIAVALEKQSVPEKQAKLVSCSCCSGTGVVNLLGDHCYCCEVCRGTGEVLE